MNFNLEELQYLKNFTITEEQNGISNTLENIITPEIIEEAKQENNFLKFKTNLSNNKQEEKEIMKKIESFVNFAKEHFLYISKLDFLEKYKDEMNEKEYIYQVNNINEKLDNIIPKLQILLEQKIKYNGEELNLIQFAKKYLNISLNTLSSQYIGREDINPTNNYISRKQLHIYYANGKYIIKNNGINDVNYNDNGKIKKLKKEEILEIENIDNLKFQFLEETNYVFFKDIYPTDNNLISLLKEYKNKLLQEINSKSSLIKEPKILKNIVENKLNGNFKNTSYYKNIKNDVKEILNSNVTSDNRIYKIYKEELEKQEKLKSQISEKIQNTTNEIPPNEIEIKGVYNPNYKIPIINETTNENIEQNKENYNNKINYDFYLPF